MSEDFGPTFITVTDEDGKELVLEFVDALEYNGQMYQAFKSFYILGTKALGYRK